MAEQGPSQRRGTESAVTPISATYNAPPESNTTSGYSPAVTLLGNDTTSNEVRPRETGITQIGVPTVVTGLQGTYTTSNLGAFAQPDYSAAIVRAKETGISPLGQTTPETSAHGSAYTTQSLGAPTPIGGTTGPSVTTYYKLRARDTGASYVEWVTTGTPLSVTSYPGTPVGTLVELTVLSIVTQ